MLPSGSSEYETNVTSSPTSGAPGTAAKAGFGGWFGGGGGGGFGGGSDGPPSTVISLVLVSVSPALSSTRMVTLHAPGPGAVTVAVPSGDLTSNLWSPVSSQRVFVIGTEGSSGVDVDVKITDVPVTTGFGAQSKSAVGFPSATPTPNGDTTAASVSKHAASRGLTWLMCILENKRRAAHPACALALPMRGAQGRQEGRKRVKCHSGPPSLRSTARPACAARSRSAPCVTTCGSPNSSPTTIRPPGFTTRRSSRRAADWSGISPSTVM